LAQHQIKVTAAGIAKNHRLQRMPVSRINPETNIHNSTSLAKGVVKTVTQLTEGSWHGTKLERVILRIARISFLMYYAVVIFLHLGASDWAYWTFVYGLGWILTALSFKEKAWQKHLFYAYGGGCFFYAALLATRLIIDLPSVIPSQYYEVISLLINVVWFYSLSLELQDYPKQSIEN
jgi:hypothetical protein